MQFCLILLKIFTAQKERDASVFKNLITATIATDCKSTRKIFVRIVKSNGPKAVIFQAHGASFAQILGGGKWARFPSLGSLQAVQKHWFCLRLLCEDPILSPKNGRVLGGERRPHFLVIFFTNYDEFFATFWVQKSGLVLDWKDLSS